MSAPKPHPPVAVVWTRILTPLGILYVRKYVPRTRTISSKKSTEKKKKQKAEIPAPSPPLHFPPPPLHKNAHSYNSNNTFESIRKICGINNHPEPKLISKKGRD